jgi:hypothetical protein
MEHLVSAEQSCQPCLNIACRSQARHAHGRLAVPTCMPGLPRACFALHSPPWLCSGQPTCQARGA